MRATISSVQAVEHHSSVQITDERGPSRTENGPGRRGKHEGLEWLEWFVMPHSLQWYTMEANSWSTQAQWKRLQARNLAPVCKRFLTWGALLDGVAWPDGSAGCCSWLSAGGVTGTGMLASNTLGTSTTPARDTYENGSKHTEILQCQGRS